MFGLHGAPGSGKKYSEKVDDQGVEGNCPRIRAKFIVESGQRSAVLLFYVANDCAPRAEKGAREFRD